MCSQFNKSVQTFVKSNTIIDCDQSLDWIPCESVNGIMLVKNIEAQSFVPLFHLIFTRHGKKLFYILSDDFTKTN